MHAYIHTYIHTYTKEKKQKVRRRFNISSFCFSICSNSALSIINIILLFVTLILLFFSLEERKILSIREKDKFTCYLRKCHDKRRAVIQDTKNFVLDIRILAVLKLSMGTFKKLDIFLKSVHSIHF